MISRIDRKIDSECLKSRIDQKGLQSVLYKSKVFEINERLQKPIKWDQPAYTSIKIPLYVPKTSTMENFQAPYYRHRHKGIFFLTKGYHCGENTKIGSDEEPASQPSQTKPAFTEVSTVCYYDKHHTQETHTKDTTQDHQIRQDKDKTRPPQNNKIHRTGRTLQIVISPAQHSTHKVIGKRPHRD